MALTQADKTFIAALIAEALAGAPAPAKARSRKAKAATTFHTKADVLAGKGFACTADAPCSRTLKTVARASVHGVANGGHEPR